MTGHLFDNNPTISLQEFAYLALNVYHDNADDYLLAPRPFYALRVEEQKKYIDQGKSGWYLAEPYTPDFNADFDGFYCDFYIKVVDKKIRYLVIAFRGTKEIGSKVEDALTWGSNVLFGNQATTESQEHMVEKASFFSLHVQHILKKYRKANILADNAEHFLVGHSLGGAIAHTAHGLLPYFIGRRSIAFNPPGIGHEYQMSKVLENCAISIRSSYDIISLIGDPYGYNININVPEQQAEAKKYFDTVYQRLNRLSDNKLSQTDQSNKNLNLPEMLKKAENAKAIFEEVYLKQHSMQNLYRAISHSQSNHMDFFHLLLAAKEGNGFHTINTQAKIS